MSEEKGKVPETAAQKDAFASGFSACTFVVTVVMLLCLASGLSLFAASLAVTAVAVGAGLALSIRAHLAKRAEEKQQKERFRREIYETSRYGRG